MPSRRALLKSVVAALAALALAAPAAAAPPRKAAEELSRLHVLVAADTNSNLRAHMQANIAFTRDLFAAGVPAERLNFVLVEGDEMSPQNVLRKIQELPVQPDDAVAFFYFGHGGFDRASDQHLFALSRDGVQGFQPLLRNDVRAALLAKGAGLTLMLTDCCSNVDALLARPARRFAGARRASELSPVLRQLFFQHRGLVDVTAADKGTLAWFGGQSGGVFTEALCARLLRKSVAELDRDGDGFVTWDELAPLLREETNRAFLDLKAQGDNRSVMVQESQYAMVFSVAQPAAGRAARPPQGGYKLGARVAAAPRGVKVVAVAPGSAAAAVGLEAGDVVLSVNGVAVRGLDDYVRLLDAAPAGRARVEVLDGRSQRVVVRDVQLERAR